MGGKEGENEEVKKETRENTSMDKDVEKLKHLCIADKNVKWCSYYGNSMAAPQKTKQTITMGSINSPSIYKPKRNESRDLI